MAVVGAGLMREIEGSVQDYLREWWTPDLWCLHSADWWRRHWERPGIVEVVVADSMADGWQLWRDWLNAIAPDNTVEIKAVERDAGSYLGYIRLVGRRLARTQLEAPIVSVPTHYTRKPLLRDEKC